MAKKSLKCPNCGAPQIDGENICQYCGTTFPSNPADVPTPTAVNLATQKKGNGCLLLFGILFGVIVAVLIIRPIAQKSTYANKIYPVGEALAYSGTEITLMKVETSEGSQYDKPKAGQELVIVTVKIKNTGSKSIPYSPFYFTMKNSQGQISDCTYTTINADTELDSGDLAPGGSTTGTVVFEEPKGDKSLILQYQEGVKWDDIWLQFRAR